MRIAVMLARAKGPAIYDLMFLVGTVQYLALQFPFKTLRST